ncbi:MAG: pyruvate formate lyase activating enzyme [Halanaerobiales bacterium]|nr:pyruvate formate lyase activating enzyme [Halanaerobiales bacterium]
MKIAGFQKTSLIEYPGKIVSVIFTQGCNLKCPYCHNSELISLESKKGTYFPVDNLLSFLQKRKGLIDGISITGGEPTLQPDLIELAREIKAFGLRIKLDTNGTNPAILKRLIVNNLLDYIAMDVKAPLSKYEVITGRGKLSDQIKQSIELIKEAGTGQAGIEYEFRTTVVPGLHEIDDIKQIGLMIRSGAKYYLQNFRPVNTLDPELMKVNGFPPTKLIQFAEAISPYVKQVEIRT